MTDQNRSNFIEFFLVGLGIAIVVFVGTYRLSESPRVWYDEGFLTQIAMNLAEYGKQAIQVSPGEFVSTGMVSSGYPLYYPVSMAYKLFGVGVLQGRSAMVAYMILLFLASYIFIRLLLGRRYALWTVFLLSTFPMLYGNGKSVLGEVPGLFFLVLCLISLAVLEKSSWRNLWAYGFFGITAGLCSATKPIFILLLPAIALAYFLYRKHINVRWSGFAIASSFFAMAMYWWFHMQFGAENSFGKIISLYANPYEAVNIWGNAIHNASLFFTETTPAFCLLMLAIWAGALILRRKKNEKIAVAETAAFIFCILILLAFLRAEPFYRCIFPAMIIGLIFLPYAGLYLSGRIRERWFPQRIFSYIPYALFIALIILNIYQLRFSSYVANYYPSRNTRDLGIYFNSVGVDKRVFLYNVPELVIFLPSHNYYQYMDPLKNAIFGKDQLAVLREGRADIVILHDEKYVADPGEFSKYYLKARIGGYDILEKIINNAL